MIFRHLIAGFAVSTLLAVATPAPVAAQPRDFGPGWGPGMMMGPGMMSRSRGWCSPGYAGFAGWRSGRLERALDLNDAQRNSLKTLTDASDKAADAIAASCPSESPRTAPARFEAMEKRMEVMLQAIRSVRPAFDAFYASLSDSQKALLDDYGPGRRRGERGGWRWRN